MDFCKRGHLWTEANTLHRPGQKPGHSPRRECRICRAALERARYAAATPRVKVAPRRRMRINPPKQRRPDRVPATWRHALQQCWAERYGVKWNMDKDL